MVAGMYPPRKHPDHEPTTNVGERRQEVILQGHFTERELKEIEFCRLYVDKFNHGTSGHNLRIIVAKMVYLLEQYCTEES